MSQLFIKTSATPGPTSDWRSTVYPLLLPLGALVVLGLFTLGTLAFFPVLMGDDWPRILGAGDWAIALWARHAAFSAGRWFKPLIWELSAMSSGLNGLSVLWLLTVGGGACLWMSRLFGVEGGALAFLFAALMLFHPVCAVHYITQTHHISHGVALAFIALATTLALDTAREDRETRALWWRRTLACAGLLACIFATRQSFCLFIIVLNIGILMDDALTHLDQPATLSPFARRLIRFQGAVLALSLLVYLAVWWLSPPLGEFSRFRIEAYQFRSTFVNSLEDVKFTVGRFAAHLQTSLMKPSHLWPLLPKTLFGVLLVGLVLAFKQRAKGLCTPVLLRKGAWFTVLLIALFIVPWAISLVRLPSNSIRMTSLLGLVPLYGMVLVLAVKHGPPRLVSVWMGAAILILFSFVSQHNFASTSALRLNLRDISVAQRILSRLEAHSAYPAFSDRRRQTVVLMGRLQDGPATKLLTPRQTGAPMDTSLVNFSVLPGLPAYAPYLFALVDYPSRVTHRQYVHARAFQQCDAGYHQKLVSDYLGKRGVSRTQGKELYAELKNRPVWPHANSLMFFRGVAFIKLDPKESEWNRIKCLLLGPQG